MARPANILILMPDQFRADCLSSAGHQTAQTPNLDRLAREGTRFESFHTTSPICMPARSSFASGLYCHNHGQWTNVGQLPAGTYTWMNALREAGYRTAHIGKSHLTPQGGGHLRDTVPFLNSLGYDDLLETTGPWATVATDSIMTDHWREAGLLDVFRDDYRRRRSHDSIALWPSPMPQGETLDDFVGRTAVNYLREVGDDRPLCTFVGFGGPHEPWDPPPSWADHYADAEVPEALPPTALPAHVPPAARQYQEEIQQLDEPPGVVAQIRRLYYGKISHIDAWIGKILATVEERGLLENTFVLFWSDHGERAGDHGGVHKSVFYDGAVHVPLILRHPDGRGAGNVATGLCETTDLLPTILDVAGLESRLPFGASLLPAMSDPTRDTHDAVFSEIDAHGVRATMIREARFKMVIDSHGNPLQLFDLGDDPNELVNLAGCPDVADAEARLRERLFRWRLATDVPQGRGGR